ncbi:MAG: endolytic transglycosylase MltG [Luteibaculaceae bacterium]
MGFFKKLLISIFLLLVVFGAYFAYDFYQKLFSPAVIIAKNQSPYLYVATGSSLEGLTENLYQNGFITNKDDFYLTARIKKFTSVKPGRYLLNKNQSNNDLINLLRSGKQVPVNVTFNNVRTPAELAGRISKQLEADSLSILAKLINPKTAAQFGFTKDNFLCMFIPNTYEFFWNSDATDFINRMAREYKNFWTTERKDKAKSLGMSQSEVCVLASIVQAEQARFNDEKPIIAGLYLNRIKRGMRLESDPTLIYALQDFSIRRVLNVHKQVVSPYNTYQNTGLPPGPINLPEPSSLLSVLSPAQHKYIFMCAKDDFSGRHSFATTLAEHNRNARKYHQALNQRKVFK